MHLLRIQVPDFRVLKNVDITFEKEFVPSVFPLGSQNGGGKSTLLQLIFVLLHCSTEPDRIPFLKNLLDGFTIPENSPKKTLAIIDIWDVDKIVQVEFLSSKDSYIKELLLPEENNNYSDHLTFSVSTKLENVKNKIYINEEEINNLRKAINLLERLKKIESFDERSVRTYQVMEELRVFGLKSLTTSSERISPKEVQDEVQERIKVSKFNLDKFYEEREQLERNLPKVLKYLRSENLIYICNYSANANVAEEVLLCRFNNIDMTEAEAFLKKLSQKIFLAAPATQVFLFLAQKSRTLLFRKQSRENDYYSQLIEAKPKLPGFFTYDFLAVDLLIESFKAARDKDFIEAIKTGEYGNSYKALMNDLNLMLVNKRININADLSGVTFKLDRDSENIELYPEDLSHGELKRLSIYMWIKYYNIEDAIVLMDEIEIALHPDWQYQIISDLNQWSPSNQYILATHSYELCQALTPAHVKELEPKLLKQEVKS